MDERQAAADVARSLLEQARQRVTDGHPEAARRLWQAAADLAEAQALPGVRMQAQHELAAFELRDRDLDAARARLDEALGLARAAAEDAPLAAIAGRLGQVLVFQGEPHHGVVVMREAVAAWDRLGQVQPVRELELAIQAVCARTDKAVAQTSDGSMARAQALFARARVRLACEDAAGARADLQAAWPLVQRGGDAESVGVVGTLLGQLLAAAGAPEATTVLTTARAAWSTCGAAHQVRAIDAMLAGG
jgi:tetratricopeptide (TPR) repeat protein